MLIVKYPERLEANGFQRLPWNNNGFPVYVKEIKQLGEIGETVLELVVNPIDGSQNELVACVQYENDPSKEHCDYEAEFPLDEVMELIHNGTIEWIPANRKVVA